MRVLFAIIWLIPTVGFLPFFIAAGVIVAIFFAVVYTTDATFDTNKNPFCGLKEAPHELWDALKELTRNMNSTLTELSHLRQRPLPPGEVPWDVTWCELFSCILTFAISLGMMYPLWIAIVGLKFLPFMLRLYIEFWKSFFSSNHGKCGWFCFGILFFFGNCLMPIPALFCAVVALFHGLGCCFYSIYVCYDYSFCCALKYMLAVIQRYDEQSYVIVMFGWDSGRQQPGKSLFCCDPCTTCCHCAPCSPTDGDVLLYANTMVDML